MTMQGIVIVIIISGSYGVLLNSFFPIDALPVEFDKQIGRIPDFCLVSFNDIFTGINWKNK